MSKAETHLLYHYTSDAGLLGIIENDNIWATNIHFLNDWTEFSHIFNQDSVATFLESFTANLPTDIDQGARMMIERTLSKRNYPCLLEIIESRPPHGEPKEAFVCSFTEDSLACHNPGDRLSQWRGYAGGSQGFSLGFDKTLLTRQVDTQNNHLGAVAELVKCIYDDESKRSTLRDMGSAAANAFIALRSRSEPVPDWFRTQHPNPSPEYRKTCAYLIKSLTTVTPTYYRAGAQFKHQGFSEEHEWRIVFHAFHNSLLSRLKFRTGQFGLTTFIEFPLRLREAGTCPLRRIVVGPSTHQTDVKNSVELLLRNHGIEGVEVVTSIIPYRTG